MKLHRLILLAPFVLMACGSSDTTPTTPGPDGDAPAPPADAPPVDGDAGPPADGEDLPEGAVDDGTNPPAFGRIDPPGFVLGPGEGVSLKGTVAYKGEAEPVGTLRLEVSVVTGPEDTPMNQMVHVEDLEGVGDFSIQVPADLGQVFLMAYFDEEMNGPNEGEMGGGNEDPITVAKANITGIELVVDSPLGDPPEGQEIGPDGKPVRPPAAEEAPAEEPAAEPAAEEAPAEEPAAEEAPAEANE